MRRRTTARQRAAAQRNIVKAQRRSAELRRGGAGSNGTTNFYGKGRKGRRAARLSTYGQKKHGLSISQRQRRKERRNKWIRRGAHTVTAAATVATVYGKLSPQQKSRVKSTGRDFKNAGKFSRMTYSTNRQMGVNRRRSAKSAGKSVYYNMKRYK